MGNIPSDILRLISTLLPNYSIHICRNVCKRWRGILPTVKLFPGDFTRNIYVLKWALEIGCPKSRDICRRVSENGNLTVLKWIKQNGNGWFYRDDVAFFAAKGGHLHIIEWLKTTKKSYNSLIHEGALRGGQKHILKWLKDRGYPIDSYNLYYPWH